MKEKIEQLDKLKQQLTSELREWVKDKSIPLDERWDVFFASGLGVHSGSLENFVNLTDDDLANVRDFNRYEIVDLDYVREYGSITLESDEAYDEFREDVLSKFIKSFEWDW